MAERANDSRRCIVGIGAVRAVSDRAELVAFALGSCVALCLYDAVAGVGAMAHVLLPAAGTAGPENTNIDISTKYADHALSEALRQMLALGADKRNIQAGIVGGAEMFPHGSARGLNIGEMNIASVTEELDKNGIPLKYAETGGKRSRTVTFTIPGETLEKQIIIRSPHL